MNRNIKGFTLMEILLVVAVLGILVATATPVYRAFLTGTELDTVQKNIMFDLKRARNNSITGENGLKWGVHFNSATGSFYYQIFSTPGVFASVSTTIESTNYLPKAIIFTVPAVSSTRDIIFEKISGTLLATSSVQIYNPSQNLTKTINVNLSGHVY
jgi:prepilin-type N-terminal cleavage/methylation domain-containing protein